MSASIAAEGTPPPAAGNRPGRAGPLARLSSMPQKRYLLTPGPTPVPPEVLAAIAEPVIHHRSPDFKAVFLEMLARLQVVFGTENEILVFTSSGTGAFES